MSTQSQRAYLVVPFQRVGALIGPSQALVFNAPAQAKLVAGQLAARHPGIAIIEREIDPVTGDDRDTLLASHGAIPPSFPEGSDWTMRLN